MFEWQYLWPAIAGGTIIALVAGPFGAMVVWQRLAYFGDTVSHSGLLGVLLAILLNVNITIGVSAIALVIALSLFRIQHEQGFAGDTVLGLLSHTLLALGLLLLSAFESIRVDILGFLYGDILAITWSDVAFMLAAGIVMLGVLITLWTPLMRLILDKSLAAVEGVKVRFTQAVFLCLLAVMIAFAMKLVGVLLITALLIIPAAAARFLAKTPPQMGVMASVLGVLAVLLGITCSHLTDLPTGPAIVVAAALEFMILGAINKLSG